MDSATSRKQRQHLQQLDKQQLLALVVQKKVMPFSDAIDLNEESLINMLMNVKGVLKAQAV